MAGSPLGAEQTKEFYVVHSELKHLMLLMALMLLVGGFSSGVVLSQQAAEGGKEPAAVDAAEDNPRAGLRVSRKR